MNFANVKEWRIPQGDVIRVTDSQNRVIWEKEQIDYTEPFYVENTTNNTLILRIYRTDSLAPPITIQYSTNKTDWRNLGTTNTTDPLIKPVSPSSKLYLRSNTTSWSHNSYENHIEWSSKIGGNIMSLLYGSNFTGMEKKFPNTNAHDIFYNLFNHTNITDSEKLLLPATTLANYCYSDMFIGCTNLKTSPKVLPAKILKTQCYRAMFYGCTSLTTTPNIYATTLATNCCNEMFYNCTSIVNAPILHSTTLVEGCYYFMFGACSSLKNVTCLATSGINTNNSTRNWLYNVPSNGTFTKAAGVTWPTGVNGIPSNWTVVEQ